MLQTEKNMNIFIRSQSKINRADLGYIYEYISLWSFVLNVILELYYIFENKVC